MSGIGSIPCGVESVLRGIGWSNGQYSTLNTMCTMSILFFFGGLSGLRSVVIWNGIRGLVISSLGHLSKNQFVGAQQCVI
jgi:hypothetical protein